eukprot:gnl/TRDRNA2_/TRDRNA2_186954_c0_seq1.p2 gnl/TRDRNA2_/TRDRNA2_186954_c0~~gnl/TRDRNA2_/TRDRNA2_186954_c0_seq1.p2  ORF type:complete len:239 (+),score=51.97 gnl/TRDRNA2_/TRDRNA2_186954_c0_seq1:162-878(+)
MMSRLVLAFLLVAAAVAHRVTAPKPTGLRAVSLLALGRDHHDVSSAGDASSDDFGYSAASAFDAADPAEKDSEQHIPSFRADGTMTFISAADSSRRTTLDMEVPTTFNKFMEGLMWRQNLTDSQGMLFQWSQDNMRGFWMENTYIDLDIIYLDHSREIVSIKQGHRLTTDSVMTDAPCTYAIEVPVNWCSRNNYTVGDHVDWEIHTTGHFVAQDKRNFGATDEEVRIAVAAGNYQINF